MKKKLAVLLAFMMILSTMCSLNLVSAEPSADAPVYNVVAGTTSMSDGNKAADQTLFEKGSWGGSYTGMFPLAVTLENTPGASSGHIYIKYDKTKVTPVAANFNVALGTWESWKDAKTGDKSLFLSSTLSGSKMLSSNLLDEGINTDEGYAYMVWNGANGPIDVNAFNELGYAAELGCFVFKTNEGVTVGEFDDNTFKLGTEVPEEQIYEQTLTYTPVMMISKNKDGNDKEYGITDSATTRLPMTVKFTYPKAEPVEQFTVTFVADGVTVKEITKNAGEKVLVSEFPAVPAKPGFTGAWDVTEDITVTKTVNAVYTPISTGDAKLNAIFTDGFKVADFDADTKEYKDIKASIGYDNYVIAGYADEGVNIAYSIDNGAFEPANKANNAFYFNLERGKMSSVKIKLTNAAGNETVYSFEIVIPAAEVSYFETSGFEIEGFNPETKEYTVTPDTNHEYMRLWGKGAENDDGIKFEYAVGEATDTPESKTYEPLAVNCGDRENGFAGTPNFDVNWSEKGFVNLWTEDGLSGKAMFIKVIGEGAPDSYYVIKFQ